VLVASLSNKEIMNEKSTYHQHLSASVFSFRMLHSPSRRASPSGAA